MKIGHIFFDIDMRCSHPGLIEIAKKKRVNLNNLGGNECAIFVNGKQNRIKMFAGGTEALLYVSKTSRIDPEAIRLLPKYLHGTELNYDKALAEAINTHMGRRRNAAKK